MRFLKQLFAILSLTLIAGPASASLASPQEGIDYKMLAKPQPVESGKKVEVIEFFGYFCPHCNALDPSLNEWVKKQGDKIAFKRVHVLFHPSMQPVQQLYVTLESMGKVEELHKKIFDAMHKQRLRLDSDAAVLAFVTQQGMDKQKFLDAYNSFSVQSKMRRLPQIQEAYGIDSVPQIIIDGRIVATPEMARASVGADKSEASLHAGLMQILDALVDKVSKEKAGKSK
jgi:thiol:disulfide interchange protein DsbA